MQPTTIILDPNANGQIVWSQDLNMYLQIYILPQSQIDSQVAEAQQQIKTAQATIDALTAIASAKIQPIIP